MQAQVAFLYSFWLNLSLLESVKAIPVRRKMSDTSAYTYEDPLRGYENAPPLPDDLTEDGKSFQNPPADGLSKAYDEFTSGVTNSKRGGTP